MPEQPTVTVYLYDGPRAGQRMTVPLSVGLAPETIEVKETDQDGDTLLWTYARQDYAHQGMRVYSVGAILPEIVE